MTIHNKVTIPNNNTTVEEANMQSIHARNVSEALYLAKQALEVNGVEVQTRNGAALEFPTPVMTTYTDSRERVLFYPQRDANPYFHFMESLWMLAGRNDVEWISQFNGRINTYSDDGEHFHGAYGFRWREWFTKDQLLNPDRDWETTVLKIHLTIH